MGGAPICKHSHPLTSKSQPRTHLGSHGGGLVAHGDDDVQHRDVLLGSWSTRHAALAGSAGEDLHRHLLTHAQVAIGSAVQNAGPGRPVGRHSDGHAGPPLASGHVVEPESLPAGAEKGVVRLGGLLAIGTAPHPHTQLACGVGGWRQRCCRGWAAGWAQAGHIGSMKQLES
jgi:hypothetical protein